MQRLAKTGDENDRKLGEFISNICSGQSINYYSYDKTNFMENLVKDLKKHFM